MENSKKKIIAPIVVIPIILLIVLIGYVIYYTNQCKDNFANVSKIKVEKYLEEKYKDDFKDVKLIGSRSDNNGGEYSWGTLYKSHFVNYYSVHSKKYDTDFLVLYEKQLFGVHTCERL